MGDLGADGDAEPSRADLVERDATNLSRQPDGAADLIGHPCHAALVGAHVGSGDVVLKTANGVAETADQLLFFGLGHGRVAEDDRFAAAVRERRRGVLEGHGARQAEALLGARGGCHAHAADRGPAGDVVNDDDRLESDARIMNVDDLHGAEVVAEPKRRLAHVASLETLYA